MKNETIFQSALVHCRVHRHDTEDSLRAAANVRHKIVVMGSAKVGKTSIIHQFLYNSFTAKYKRTVEEMHQGAFSISGVNLTLDILDTSGAYEVCTSIYQFICNYYINFVVFGWTIPSTHATIFQKWRSLLFSFPKSIVTLSY